MLSSVLIGDKGDPGPRGSAQLTSQGMKGEKGNDGLPGPKENKVIHWYTYHIVVKHICQDQLDTLVGKENVDQED